MTEDWPHQYFAAVPGPQVAASLATDIRRRLLVTPEARCHIGAICKGGGFEYTTSRLAGRHEAVMMPRADGKFLIAVDERLIASSQDSTVARRRLRWRLAHEIGHSFFYDRESTPATRLLPPSRAEEAFCQTFASTLLVPSRALEEFPTTANGVRALSQVYDVSMRVAAWALVKHHSGLSIVGLGWRSHPTRGGEECLRTVWAASAEYVPLGARFKQELLPTIGILGRGSAVGNLKLGGLRGRFEVDAYPNARGMSAIVFLRRLREAIAGRASDRSSPDSPSSATLAHSQPSLFPVAP